MQKTIRLKHFAPLAGVLFIAATLAACVGGQLGKNNSGEYRNGMVVSANAEASGVGLNILKKGGNAVDAAVAVQFALAVVYPNAGNLGGGGFMVYRSASGETNALDFREKAPGLAFKDMYLDAAGNPVKEKSLDGHLAAGVPGSVAGMVEAHQKYGKLKWAELVQPAVLLARNGFKITARTARELNREKERFVTYNPLGTALVKEGEWAEGDVLVQNELANTLEQIRDKGRAGFYEGPVADSLVAEMKRGAGIISAADLKNYKAVWRKPIVGNYKAYKIITMPPTSSGGIALLQLLKSVEPYPLKRWGLNSDSTVQVMVEAERRVYADRATHLGDPDFFKVPQKQLIDPAYIKSRMSNFNWAQASLSSDIKAGVFNVPEHEETTHFSIVDRDGNAVSLTTTLNGSYGSAVVVKGAGFLLNNEMDDFSVKPGAPNMYGLLGGEANAIVPEKRMLSSMTPTIIEKDGKLFMVVGTPGGSTIMTSVFQTIINVIEFDKSMQSAVTAKRFHHQWMPDSVYVEKGTLDSAAVLELTKRGYHLKPRGPIGRVDAILKTKWGYYQGGADPRGDDKAMGW
ncbi:gamma-glutamyltransferase [Pedobacter heparinus]|uniref:Glutathione hydrolase proenzyme n=1 Tax=Pedobacter heparinus (strain ATCC 13125 / DSM 2366 / CIP 104194 / JCM 7457 / NBRC 12017 / NCIMB 9290 / NRRL B-14731 / HIM 762-3) TaxID=485917 RepID=C6XUC9_PEDHD|nr:gamma-glutamyltransferase [Pedobacter heparinus]ACU05922.1 gamma-glutamyltransferase [Pedobacter heparinus DSM 2366]